MRCIPRLFAFVCLALVCAAPAYSVQFLYQTVRIDPNNARRCPRPRHGWSERTNSFAGHRLWHCALRRRCSHIDVGLQLLRLGHRRGYTEPQRPIFMRRPRYRSREPLASPRQRPSFAGFPIGVTVGTFHSALDLTLASSWNPSYVTANGGTTAAPKPHSLPLSRTAGRTGISILSKFPGGEIRGFMQLVPEPASCVLVGLGLARPREHRTPPKLSATFPFTQALGVRAMPSALSHSIRHPSMKLRLILAAAILCAVRTVRAGPPFALHGRSNRRRRISAQ